MKRRHILLILTLFITTGGLAIGAQDTFLYYDYRSGILDIWILIGIIGYWWVYLFVGRKAGQIKALTEHLTEVQEKVMEEQAKLQAISELLSKAGGGKTH